MKDWHARGSDIELAMNQLAPRLLPVTCRVMDDYVNAKRYALRLDDALLTVILEVEAIVSAETPELWAHLSVGAATQKRVPTWKELRWCKDFFLGDRKAIQVLPVKAEYVNINPYVLHLYSPLERDPLPDFRGVDSRGTLGI